MKTIKLKDLVSLKESLYSHRITYRVANDKIYVRGVIDGTNVTFEDQDNQLCVINFPEIKDLFYSK